MRLALDCDYDRLEHLANYDGLLGQILGLHPVTRRSPSNYKTLSENVCHVDEELLQQINAGVVQAGVRCSKKGNAPAEPIRANADTYVTPKLYPILDPGSLSAACKQAWKKGTIQRVK